MPIDPKVEEPTRTMLAHAMRHELDELAALIHAKGNEIYLGSISLCLFASGYIAIDVSGNRWPSEVVLRKIAHNASDAATGLDLDEAEIYEYLSRVALGSETLDDVFPMEAAITLPVLITANLLATFRPRDKHWWEYLDQIWNAANTAERISPTVFPAVLIRAHKEARRAQKGTT